MSLCALELDLIMPGVFPPVPATWGKPRKKPLPGEELNNAHAAVYAALSNSSDTV